MCRSVLCAMCCLMLFVFFWGGRGALSVVPRCLLVAVVAGCSWLFVVCCLLQCGVGCWLLAVCNWLLLCVVR